MTTEWPSSFYFWLQYDNALLFDFETVTNQSFETRTLALFRYQVEHVMIYREFVRLLGIESKNVNALSDIPHLPISFFKSQRIISDEKQSQLVFESSTTTGATPSKHFVADPVLYERSCMRGFENIYGSPESYCILALLPSYLERGNSSLVWMVNKLMEASGDANNGFYLHDFDKLTKTVKQNEASKIKTLVIGVSYALLDWAETWSGAALQHTTIMETGGMKGKRKELVKDELHAALMQAFGVDSIHSEYGMTELLSQAYSTGKQAYRCPDWMKITAREINDPFNQLPYNEAGAINIIDLANQYSCAFIATDDLGKVNDDGTFNILGRMDASEMRGCNLLV